MWSIILRIELYQVEIEVSHLETPILMILVCDDNAVFYKIMENNDLCVLLMLGTKDVLGTRITLIYGY